MSPVGAATIRPPTTGEWRHLHRYLRWAPAHVGQSGSHVLGSPWSEVEGRVLHVTASACPRVCPHTGRGLGRHEALLPQVAPAHCTCSHACACVCTFDGCAPHSCCHLKCVRTLRAHACPAASVAPSREALEAQSGPGDPISRTAPRPCGPLWGGRGWSGLLPWGRGDCGHGSWKAPSRASSGSPATHSRGTCLPSQPGTETQVWAELCAVRTPSSAPLVACAPG